MQQRARAKVDVEVESEPQSQEDVTRVFVAGHTRVAERAEEYCIHVVPEMFVDIVGKSLAGVEVMARPVRQMLPHHCYSVPLGGGLDDWNSGGDDFGPDAVASDDGDLDAAIQRITFLLGRRR